jgi:gamma-D-glutamyl-L-lysine dipeptidyl-peptidase
MQYILITLPVVPLRAGPSDKDEMTSQALFGEAALVIEEHQKWCFVELVIDGYRGWVYEPMTTRITAETASMLENSNKKFLGNLFLPVVENKGKYPLLIPAGSNLYDYKPASNTFHVGEQLYNCIQEPVFYTDENIREDITAAAMIFINTPYLWGGKKSVWNGLLRSDADCTKNVRKVYSKGFTPAS